MQHCRAFHRLFRWVVNVLHCTGHRPSACGRSRGTGVGWCRGRRWAFATVGPPCSGADVGISARVLLLYATGLGRTALEPAVGVESGATAEVGAHVFEEGDVAEWQLVCPIAGAAGLWCSEPVRRQQNCTCQCPKHLCVCRAWCGASSEPARIKLQNQTCDGMAHSLLTSTRGSNACTALNNESGHTLCQHSTVMCTPPDARL